MRILFAAAELSPLIRTGGLGEAVAGLAGALAGLGHEVTVAVPSYRDLGSPGRKLRGEPWRNVTSGDVSILTFVDASFDRPGVYGPGPGQAYDDNWERFGRFSVAVAAIADRYDVVHLHDAHVGASALLIDGPSVFTVHNASYPMLAPLAAAAELLGLSRPAALGGPLEWFGEANYLKAGIVGADQATTVSPTHARELAEDATSFGLGGIVRGLARPIVGILNGIDTKSWDPAADPSLPARFDGDSLERRTANRLALLDLLDLEDGFVLGTVGRMAPQKGIDLLHYDIDALVSEGFRFVFVGNGELDAVVDGWSARHRQQVAHRPYDETLARLVSAGVDAYLMPSHYEPCGLGQMYAMRYGAPPVAHSVGGLRDTVIDVDEDLLNGTGFVFRSYNHASSTKTLRRARRYHDLDPALWQQIQRAGMSRDWSWAARAAEYLSVYEEIAS